MEMARNEEKNLARLNRLILQNQKDENLKKNPPRPRLDTLETVEDIKKWLPSIKRDIDFNLKQSQVPCYPERKIQEFRSNVDHLQGLYKAFVRKLKGLDPQLTSIPWNDRVYESKKRHYTDDITHQDQIEVESKTGKFCLNKEGLDENGESSTEKNQISENAIHFETDSTKCEEDAKTTNKDYTNPDKITFVQIHTPILDTENKCKNISQNISDSLNSNVNLALQDQPLTFREFQDQPLNFNRKGTYLETAEHNEGKSSNKTSIENMNTHHQNVTLGLPYSDSDSNSDSDINDNG